jgi:pimeloyl-ACP methyl ester carboxylesterase
MQTRTLEAPGASLYYEVRGSGPVLLMIPGGPMDAAGFAPLADALADRYTVVTCDCRGNSRSTAEGPKDDLTVGVFADDAHRLLTAVTSEPAFVLGSSGGASYGLDLVARYPEQVRTLVAHVPRTGVPSPRRSATSTGAMACSPPCRSSVRAWAWVALSPVPSRTLRPCHG